MSMWPDLPVPFIFAHRGASAHAPENTLAAFTLAARQGAPAIELDAKLSADGQVVVIHDPTVDRTTDGTGRVADLPLAILKELEAGAKFNVQFKGERIPTLDEVFETIGRDLFINIELTNYSTRGDMLVERAVELVRRHALEVRVMFSSFLPANLRRAAELLPDVPGGMLALPGLPGFPTRLFLFPRTVFAAVHPFHGDLTPALVRAAHRRRQRVYVWTVNAERDMRRMRALGVDAIFTDDPPLARRVFLEGA